MDKLVRRSFCSNDPNLYWHSWSKNKSSRQCKRLRAYIFDRRIVERNRTSDKFICLPISGHSNTIRKGLVSKIGKKQLHLKCASISLYPCWCEFRICHRCQITGAQVCYFGTQSTQRYWVETDSNCFRGLFFLRITATTTSKMPTETGCIKLGRCWNIYLVTKFQSVYSPSE